MSRYFAKEFDMNETESKPNEKGDEEGAATCPCCCHGKNALDCLERLMRDNPRRGVCWCLGIGLLVGWKIKSCLHSMIRKG
jgi:ElaB/YqjD/DUF883 family membrane-anchored ribosome-binding protein